MCIFAKYKDAFGEPSKGIHAYRLFNVAVVDVVLTAVAAYGAAAWFRCSFAYTLVCLLVIGEVFHVLFGVDTTVVRWMRASAAP
jgi:hypothetical protein